MKIEESESRETSIKVDLWLPIFLKEMQKGKTLKLSPWGYSMYPFLVSKRDDVIIKISEVEIKRGDICLYRREDGTHVLHTVFRVTEENVFFLGDNQSKIEGPLKKEQIIATVTTIIRKGKIISCSNKKYIFLHNLWLTLRIYRPFILKCWHLMRVVSGIDKRDKIRMKLWEMEKSDL